jgi:cyclase
MLKIRIIPTLLWKDYGLVKGVAFDSWRRIGTIIPAIKVYNTRQVDELIIVDILATRDNREPDYETIREFSAECFMPLSVGGGVRTLDHIKKLLRVGADKVVINSAAYETPQLITEGAQLFGSQCMVVSIDAKKNTAGMYECYSHSGTIPTGQEVSAWAKNIETLGAGEIVINNVDYDGTMKGFDLELIKLLTDSVKIPVIAAGGAGSYEDLYQAISMGKAQAVSAASMFHFTEQTPLEAKNYLAAKGLPVRTIGP